MNQPANYKGHYGQTTRHTLNEYEVEQRAREGQAKREEAEAQRWMQGLVMSVGVHRQDDGRYRLKFYGLPECTGPEITMDEGTFKQLSTAVTQMAGNPDLKQFVTD